MPNLSKRFENIFNSYAIYIWHRTEGSPKRYPSFLTHQEDIPPNLSIPIISVCSATQTWIKKTTFSSSIHIAVLCWNLINYNNYFHTKTIVCTIRYLSFSWIHRLELLQVHLPSWQSHAKRWSFSLIPGHAAKKQFEQSPSLASNNTVVVCVTLIAWPSALVKWLPYVIAPLKCICRRIPEIRACL